MTETYIKSVRLLCHTLMRRQVFGNLKVTSMQIELHAMREDYLRSSCYLDMKSSEFFFS